MRSRYAAFAAGEVDYLWKTLHPDHEDRAAPKATVLAALREACRVNRYTGLTIKGETPPDAEGVATVTFVARVFRKGRDVSFGERSMFARTSDGWRYLAGELLDNAPPKG
jgi:SEC-C motif-containing protein